MLRQVQALGGMAARRDCGGKSGHGSERQLSEWFMTMFEIHSAGGFIKKRRWRLVGACVYVWWVVGTCILGGGGTGVYSGVSRSI